MANLIKWKEIFQLQDNIYLFGIPGTDNPISGYNVMRKYAKLALGDVKKAALLTSTKLRKHLGTIAQIFRMEKNDLEQLAQFMGHTEKSHAEWYRLPNDVYQTAKVSKLLMLCKEGREIEKFLGKSLSEINFDDYWVEEELVEGAEEREENNDIEDDQIQLPDPVELPEANQNCTKVFDAGVKVKKGRKRMLVP